MNVSHGMYLLDFVLYQKNEFRFSPAKKIIQQ